MKICYSLVLVFLAVSISFAEINFKDLKCATLCQTNEKQELVCETKCPQANENISESKKSSITPAQQLLSLGHDKCYPLCFLSCLKDDTYNDQCYWGCSCDEDKKFGSALQCLESDPNDEKCLTQNGFVDWLYDDDSENKDQQIQGNEKKKDAEDDYYKEKDYYENDRQEQQDKQHQDIHYRIQYHENNLTDDQKDFNEDNLELSKLSVQLSKSESITYHTLENPALQITSEETGSSSIYVVVLILVVVVLGFVFYIAYKHYQQSKQFNKQCSLYEETPQHYQRLWGDELKTVNLI